MAHHYSSYQKIVSLYNISTFWCTLQTKFNKRLSIFTKILNELIKDTDNPPDIDGASQAVQVLGKLFNVFADHRGQLATSRYPQRIWRNKSTTPDGI